MKQFLPAGSERQQTRQAQPAALAPAGPSPHFVDNRPEALAQRKLKETFHTSPHMLAQRKLAAELTNSPHMVAQRKLRAFMNRPAIQLQAAPENEVLPGKFEAVQRVEEDELLQGKFATAQLTTGHAEKPLPQKPNNTGLPDNLKSGIENLSGYSMDDVKVHYNSAKPAQLNAHAYAQGTDIHLASGQERHLPHEAWHVVQQKQGRVRPTVQMQGGVGVNDDRGLESEADLMGGRSSQDSATPVQFMLRTLLTRITTSRARALSSRQAPLRRRTFATTAGEEEALANLSSAPNPASTLIRRKSVTTAGIDFGYLSSTPNPTYRATQAPDHILTTIDQTGFLSGATRQGAPQNSRDVTAKEITSYSGVVGQGESTFRGSRLIGMNENAIYTVGVAQRTNPPGNSDQTCRLDEINRSQLGDEYSVEAAFRATGEQNQHPIEGETVTSLPITPGAMGHTATVPLSRNQGQFGQPGQVHPAYLINLALVTGSTREEPQTFDIETRTHRSSNGDIEIDTLNERR